MNYLIAIVSNSHHLMSEPPFYFKIYKVKADSYVEANRQIEFLARQFSLEYKIGLEDVMHLWTCKIK